ncbi:MAG: hypothetical protein AAF752_08590 [Bacteroidota bacterium]
MDTYTPSDVQKQIYEMLDEAAATKNFLRIEDEQGRVFVLHWIGQNDSPMEAQRSLQSLVAGREISQEPLPPVTLKDILDALDRDPNRYDP